MLQRFFSPLGDLMYLHHILQIVSNFIGFNWELEKGSLHGFNWKLETSCSLYVFYTGTCYA